MQGNLKIKIPEKLEPFLTKHKRFKVAYGGRGGAKSQSFTDMLLMKAHVEGIKVGCFREYQNSIEDSVHSLLVEEYQRLEIPGFSHDKTHVFSETGGEFRFKGLNRSPSAVKSMHGFKVFWTEEAEFLSSDSLKILEPTLRAEGAELWFSFNPQSSADPVCQRFIEPFKSTLDSLGYYEDDLHYIVKINYDDNPWFPESLEQQRVSDYERLSRAEYDHVWHGEYNDTVEGSIIPAEWFDAAVDSHKKLGFKPRGAKLAAFDPSDEGADDKGLVIRHGSVVTWVDLLETGDSAEGMDWALDRAIAENVDSFTWDCDGLGISLKRQVSDSLDGKAIRWSMFKGSETADRPDEIYEDTGDFSVDQTKTNRQTFKNKRAQNYWALRDRFYNTYLAVEKGVYIDPDKLISISSDIKCLVALKSEVCRVPKKHNGNGLIQIMSKEDMKRLRIKSPNLADSLMMSMRYEEEPVIDINYNYGASQSSWLGM